MSNKCNKPINATDKQDHKRREDSFPPGMKTALALALSVVAALRF